MKLERELLGHRFRAPVLLAAGTCGFGREVAGVTDLQALGGLVTKSVTLEPRAGNPAPRVAEVHGAMLNSVGLANPGAEAVRREHLPWMRARLRGLAVWISVAGHRPDEYVRVVEILDGEEGFGAFELNLSCPNDTRLEGRAFALDPEAVDDVVGRVRGATDRPLLVKLAPNDPDLPETARRAEAAGADGITVLNTLPGLALRGGRDRPLLGAGPGGMSGPALRPAGIHAVWRVAAAVRVPVVGVGGVLSAEDAWQYLAAGASLVQVGTGSFADPRCAERVVRGLRRLGRERGVDAVEAVPRLAPPGGGGGRADAVGGDGSAEGASLQRTGAR